MHSNAFQSGSTAAATSKMPSTTKVAPPAPHTNTTTYLWVSWCSEGLYLNVNFLLLSVAHQLRYMRCELQCIKNSLIAFHWPSHVCHAPNAVSDAVSTVTQPRLGCPRPPSEWQLFPPSRHHQVEPRIVSVSHPALVLWVPSLCQLWWDHLEKTYQPLTPRHFPLEA